MIEVHVLEQQYGIRSFLFPRSVRITSPQLGDVPDALSVNHCSCTVVRITPTSETEWLKVFEHLRSVVRKAVGDDEVEVEFILYPMEDALPTSRSFKEVLDRMMNLLRAPKTPASRSTTTDHRSAP